MFLRLRREAVEVVKQEPVLSMLLSHVGLLDPSSLPAFCNGNAKVEPAKTFEEIIARIVSHRLISSCSGPENICPKFLRNLVEQSFHTNGEEALEMGHTMSYAVREDARSILRRDPACETLLEAVLFMKGFHSLVIHRAARRAWKPAKKEDVVTEGGTERSKTGTETNENDSTIINVSGQRFVALLLQSQAASAFGVDIHPACSIGAGVMIDHASGVVIGETAVVGDGTTILHGVTLGGTGKQHGDRHPKIGKDVLIGAGTKILGNITVGDRAKIGAGSVVLRPIPSGATAVGAPAKIIGFTPRDERPGSSVDMKLEGVEPLLGTKKLGMKKSVSEGSSATEVTVDSSVSESVAAERTTSVHFKNAEDGKEEDKESLDETEESSSKGEEEEEAHKKVSSEEEDEEDDNITDFGTEPKCRWVKVCSHDDGLCPFKGSFRNISSSMRKDSIEHAQLRSLLIQEGCTEGECVEVFFELLHCTPAASKARECGCIPLEIFSQCFPEIAKEKTRLDEDTITALSRGDLRALGMSKKASRRFRSMFSNLGKRHSVSAMQRIPSSGSLPGFNGHGTGALHKSERERMEGHLDTRAYAEGITI